MSDSPHSASNSIIVRLKLSNVVGVLAGVTRIISEMECLYLEFSTDTR